MSKSSSIDGTVRRIDRVQSLIGYSVAAVLCIAAMAKTVDAGGNDHAALIAVEFGLGLSLLLWPRNQLIWHGAIGLFTVFSLVSFSRWQSGYSSCGCFGAFDTSPYVMFVFDLLVVVVMSTVSLARSHVERRAFSGVWGTGLLLVIVVLVSGAVAGAAKITTHGSLVFEPEEAVGRELPFLNEIQTPVDLNSGHWLLVFYREGCPACDAVLARLETGEFDVHLRGMPTILVAVLDEHTPGAMLPGGWIRETPTVLIPTPTMVELVDGRVARAHRAEEL